MDNIRQGGREWAMNPETSQWIRWMASMLFAVVLSCIVSVVTFPSKSVQIPSAEAAQVMMGSPPDAPVGPCWITTKMKIDGTIKTVELFLKGPICASPPFPGCPPGNPGCP